MGVEPGGPAQQAGVEEGDLIVGLNDRIIASIDDLHKQLSQPHLAKSANYNWPETVPASTSPSRRQSLAVNTVPTPH